MKYLLALSIWAASLGCSPAQGLVNFYNTPSTLVSDTMGGSAHPINLGVQAYFFALLTSPVGANTFTFAGVYATNTMAPGIINGGSGVAVPGWAAGTARDFAVFGWDTTSGGITYNPSWLKPNLWDGANDPVGFGVSSIGTGVAGGVTGGGTAPTLDLFGGPTGIQRGFALTSPVPEPSSIGLATLGAVLLVGSRWREKSGKNLRFFDAAMQKF